MLTGLAALTLGALLPAAFAPYSIFPFAILCLAGLMDLLQKATPKKAFWLGYLFGMGSYGAGLYWVFISIHYMGEVPSFFAALITLGMVMILSLYPAVTCYAANRFFAANQTTKVVLAFPALWVFSEWWRSWLLNGFPWLFIGYSQINSPLKGFAPFFSVYGVSLAALMTSGLLVTAIMNIKQKNYRQTYLSLFAICTIWIAGSALNLMHFTKPQGNPISVSLVQGNIPQEMKWVPEHIKLSFDRYSELTQSLMKKGRIIVWPESAIPMTLQDADSFIKEMDEKAIAADSHIILGIPVESKNGYFNGIVTLGKDKASYAKRRLVPFGEYIPMQDLIGRLLSWMDVPMGNLIPGKNVQEPMIINHVKILPSICFEVAFPELLYTNDDSVGMLLTITNDAWFGESSAQAQHLEMARMRALELMRPVLFASNDGITAIIGPDGNVISSLPPRTVGVLTANVQPMQGATPWMNRGMGSVLMLLTSLLIFAWRKNRKAIKKLKIAQQSI